MLLIWETMDWTLPTIIQVSWSKLLGARVGGQGEFSRRFTSEQMSFFQWQTLEIFRKIENKWMLPIIVCSFPVLIIKIRENWKVGKGLSGLQESLTSWRTHKCMGMDLTPFKWDITKMEAPLGNKATWWSPSRDSCGNIWLNQCRFLSRNLYGSYGTSQAWVALGNSFHLRRLKKHENSKPQPEKKTFSQIEDGRTSIY